MKKTLVIFMGGTILLVWSEKEDKLIYDDTKDIELYIRKLLKGGEMEFRMVCMKESTDINAEDRGEMLTIMQNSAAEQVIIIHGSLTAEKTAEFIAANRSDVSNKSIVIVGSTAPFCVKDSLAPANLGAAVAMFDGSVGNGASIYKWNSQISIVK